MKANQRHPNTTPALDRTFTTRAPRAILATLLVIALVTSGQQLRAKDTAGGHAVFEIIKTGADSVEFKTLAETKLYSVALADGAGKTLEAGNLSQSDRGFTFDIKMPGGVQSLPKNIVSTASKFNAPENFKAAKIKFIIEKGGAEIVMDIPGADTPGAVDSKPAGTQGPAAEYLGAWKYTEGKNSEQITITANKIVSSIYMDIGIGVIGPLDLTLEHLAWEPIANPGGGNSSGYTVKGTVSAVPGAGTTTIATPDGGKAEAKVGAAALEWFYMRNGRLMKGNSESKTHEAKYGPYDKISSTETAK